MDNDNIVAVFNEIYDKYYKKIFAYFRKDFGKDDAEDLTQQAFMQLWAWLPNRYLIENKKALIYQIAKNVKLDKFRKNKLMLETMLLPEDFDPMDRNSFSNMIDYKMSVYQLKPKEQNLLLMSLQGYNSKEIGKAMGITPSAVRSRLQKIRNKLK